MWWTQCETFLSPADEVAAALFFRFCACFQSQLSQISQLFGLYIALGRPRIYAAEVQHCPVVSGCFTCFITTSEHVPKHLRIVRQLWLQHRPRHHCHNCKHNRCFDHEIYCNLLGINNHSQSSEKWSAPVFAFFYIFLNGLKCQRLKAKVLREYFKIFQVCLAMSNHVWP